MKRAFIAVAFLSSVSLASAETVDTSEVTVDTVDEISTAFESRAARPVDAGPVFLTAEQRRERAVLIRDAAATHGMTNGALLAGIGEIETNFAHCWSEATWACKGPASSSCNGGPVIAGSADGPCGNEQGGLGMFQFDSGTYAQTIATYGPDIVTIQGNVGAVIPFLVTRAIESVDGVNSEAEAIAWMNSITIQDGNADYEEWLYFVAWRYNGCKGCTTQINKYRMGTNKLATEFGPDFWNQAPSGGGSGSGSGSGSGGGNPDPGGEEPGDTDEGPEITAGPCSSSPQPGLPFALLGFAIVFALRRRR